MIGQTESLLAVVESNLLSELVKLKASGLPSNLYQEALVALTEVDNAKHRVGAVAEWWKDYLKKNTAHPYDGDGGDLPCDVCESHRDHAVHNDPIQE